METKTSILIADEIETMILEGLFADGDRLDEAQLASRFSVSRTPIREALQRLTLSGLVEQLPRRGVFVRHPGPIELIEMFEVMAELEAICVRLAASRISEAALSELTEANTRCLAMLEAGDADGFYVENEKFHRTIYGSAGNTFLEQECRRLHRRLKPFRRIQLRVRGRLNQSMAEHDEILAALVAGDGERGALAIRDHVAVQGEKFHHLIAGLKGIAAQ